jgi:hypothetical protein
MTDSIVWKPPMIGLMGPPGSGKSHFAATFIPEFVEAVASKKIRSEPLHVKNVVWLLSDPGGSDTMAQYNIFPEVIDWVPTPLAYVDPTTTEGLQELRKVRLKWLRHKLETLETLRKREGVELVVVDAMTTLARAATDAHLAEQYCNEKFNGKAAYGKANMDIGLIIAKLKVLSCPVIVLAHCRSAYVAEATAETIAEAAAEKPIESKLEIDVQAGIKHPLERMTSLWAGLEVNLKSDGTKEHKLITRPDKKFAIKSRWEAALPANPKTLREVWDSIRRST